MKIRNGFVSNSSSSSFTCDVCGQTESGMDLCLNDCEMARCERNHTFCQAEMVKTTDDFTADEKRQYLVEKEKGVTWRKPEEVVANVERLKTAPDDKISEEFEENIDWSELPAATCPVCRMDVLTDYDALAYLFVKHSLTSKDLLAEIKALFADYKSFHQYTYQDKK